MWKIFENLKNKFYLNSQITVFDNSKILVENCKNVLEVNENLVRVVSCNYEIEIWGTGLFTTNFSSKAVMIKGKIQNVSINERRKKSNVV